MVRRPWCLFAALGIAVTLAAIPAYSQECQNEICSYTPPCFQCLGGGGYYPKSRTYGVCYGAVASNTAEASLLLIACGATHPIKAQRPAAIPRPSGTRVRSALQTRSPLLITRATTGVDDLLEHAVLLNTSKNEILSYKIGWVITFHDPNKAPVEGFGEEIHPSGGIEAGEYRGVDSQHVSGTYLSQGAAVVEFFVAEALYDDGRVFTADINEMTEKAKMP